MSNDMMDSILKSLLVSTGGYNDICNAMDSNDLADVVRAAIEALKKTLSIPMVLSDEKCAKLSNEFRTKGNKYFKNEDYETAIILYNKALAYAPKNSIEVKYAFANLSAVMFSIKAYQECLNYINACFALDCPHFLKKKLQKRMEDAEMFINRDISEDILKNHLELDEANSEVPCVSKDIECININGCKNIVAGKDIKSGTIIAIERAFVSTQSDDNQFTSCYYCHKMSLFFIPCDGCCKALFCSKNCKNRCLDDYHRVECQIVAYMGTMYIKPDSKLTTRTAIKLSLNLGWKALSIASKEIGAKRLKKSSIKSAFDVSDPLSILSYDDKIDVIQGRIYNGSFICAAAVHCLSRVPNYFPKESNARKEAIDALSRIMLHLYATFTNKITIECSAYDLYSNTIKTGIQRNIGWFSFASKLPHSCEPNLVVLGLNDHVALVAIKPIKKGEELNITYVDHFYDTTIGQDYRSEKFANIRQQMIISRIKYLCECRVCLQRWDTNSHTRAKMTIKQHRIFINLVVTANAIIRNKIDTLKVSAAALDDLCELPNTTEHRSAYRVHRYALFECYCAKTENKTYSRFPL